MLQFWFQWRTRNLAETQGDTDPLANILHQAVHPVAQIMSATAPFAEHSRKAAPQR
jgi:hypothetical protein